MGVNLPAHLVVIKSTEIFQEGGMDRYNEIHIQQMIGRAGRPQFDNEATAVIMTRLSTKVLINYNKQLFHYLHTLEKPE